ncbi:unnamed protein product [Umbelopsis vinacea]
MPLFPTEEGIVRVLSQSMAAFGKVKNVSIFKKPVGHGKYHSNNGEGFILLDTTSTDESSYIELKPFIFIPEWQTTIQAKWDNAPPAYSATTIITPTKNEQDHNNNNHQSQESIDVESLTNSQLREINVVQTVVSQQMSTDNSKPIETLNEEDNTVDEEDADYCTEDDQMSTESDDSHAADTNDQR